MSISHPEYPSLSIRVAALGEKAKPGAFYVTKAGRYLSHVASQAYGSGDNLAKTLRINRSSYNQLNCTYRRESNSCSSPIVPGHMADMQKTWNPGAWISVCQADRGPIAQAQGFAFQVFWIPTHDGKEPWDLVGAKPPASVIKPPDVFVPSPGTKTNPGLKIVAPPPDGRIKGPEPDPGTEQKAGFGGWPLAVAAGVVVVGGIIVWAKKRKKKK